MLNTRVAEEIYDALQMSSQESITYSNLNQQQSRMSLVEKLIDEATKTLGAKDQLRIAEEFLGNGPLQVLMEDESITEIIANDYQSIFFECRGHLHRHPDQFLNPTTYKNYVERLCAETGSHFNLERPILDGCIEGFRVNIAGSALTQKDDSICLRRHPKNPWTFPKLLATGWCSESELHTILEMIQSRSNFLVIGGTGSGKTSILNACLGVLPDTERAVVIEDSPELSLGNSVSTRIVTRIDPHKILPPISQADLVKQSLRMRPDRLVMGEIRGDEAKDFLMALATGHAGSFGTLHANNPHQALLRLEMLIQMGAPFWSLTAIRQLISLSLNHVLVTGRRPDGSRGLQGLFKLTSLEETGLLLEAVRP